MAAADASYALPELEKSDEDFKREWGISREREEILLAEFRTQLEAAVGPLKPMFDRFYLRRFLRARQHDLVKAKAMFQAHLKWRVENKIDTILQDFHFQERDAFLSQYPQGYHKTDKMGRPIYIQHIGAIKIKQLAEVTTDDRMIRFHVQEYERCLKYIFPACSKKAGRHIDQTFAIMDVKGVGLKHLTGDVKSILTRITETDQNNYPETLGKTVIINAPTVFKMIWAMVRPMLDIRTQAKIEVAPSDYMKLLLRHIDIENIPDYLGGKSKGSLIDDVGPWKDPTILAMIEADILRRERAATRSQDELDGGIVSGDSTDLEPAGSSTQFISPNLTQLRQPDTVLPHEQTTSVGEPQRKEAILPLAQGAASTQPASPFDVQGAFKQQRSSGHMDSGDIDDFRDANSRRQSILSSGSSAYLSAGEDDSDFFTPKHGDHAQVGTSGLSFRSDRPLLMVDSSGAASPHNALQVPVAGIAASPPATSEWQQQQRQQQFLDAAGGQQPPLVSEVGASRSNGGQDLTVDWNLAQQITSKGDAVPLPMQIPILARVRALEGKLPKTGHEGSTPQGTLLQRVEALERAMDSVLRARENSVESQQHLPSGSKPSKSGSSSCCSCCCIM